MKEKIKELEERLRIAMLNSDVDDLDQLISPELLFTNHFGHLVSKTEDLESHRKKTVVFKSNELSESEILVAENFVVASIRSDIRGFYNEQEAHGSF